MEYGVEQWLHTLMDDRKNQLAERILDFLLDTPDPDPSFRALASAAGVTRPTLIHHFGDRAGTIRAAIGCAAGRARPFVRLAQSFRGTPQRVLRMVFGWMAQGWMHERLGRLHQIGLLNGLTERSIGATYLTAILEPTLTTFEEILIRMRDEGQLSLDDPRAASLQLVSPVFVVLLHQEHLGGRENRPLDLDGFLDDHIDAFVRAHRPEG